MPSLLADEEGLRIGFRSRELCNGHVQLRMELLPQSHVQLLNEFDAIDQVWCFCRRLRIVPTLNKVGEIFRSTLQRELDQGLKKRAAR